jgi:hypothetical protein
MVYLSRFIPVADVLSICIDVQLEKRRDRIGVDSANEDAIPAIWFWD